MEKLTTAAKDLIPGLMIDHEYDDCKHRDVLIIEVKTELDENGYLPKVIRVEAAGLDEEDKPVINNFEFDPEEELATTDFLYKLRIVEKREKLLEKVIKNYQKDMHRHYEIMAEIEMKFKKIRDNHYVISLDKLFEDLEEMIGLPPF